MVSLSPDNIRFPRNKHGSVTAHSSLNLNRDRNNFKTWFTFLHLLLFTHLEHFGESIIGQKFHSIAFPLLFFEIRMRNSRLEIPCEIQLWKEKNDPVSFP